MHEGEVSARLGLAGIPSISESTMIARDAAIAGYEEGRIHIQHLSARESVEAVAEAKARGVRITAEASPHHLTLTHDAILERLDTRLKMNPPLRTEADRQALIDGPARRHDRLHRHRPRAARARGEGGAVRAGADGHDRAGDGVRRGLHRAGRARRAAAGARRRASSAPARRWSACRRRGSRSARRPTLCLVDLEARVGGRRGRLRVALGELLLRRPRRCAAACWRRSPPAPSSTGSGRSP